MSPLRQSPHSSELGGTTLSAQRSASVRASRRADARFLPFSAPDLDDDELVELTETLRAGWLSTGAKVREFEQQFAKFVGVKHAIAVNNGTTAFRLALRTLALKPGHEVIMSPFAPIVAAELVRATGAVPRLVDVTERGLHLSPELVNGAVGPHTRALLVSHVAGLPAEMDELLAVARRHHLLLIEDAGHALSATYRHEPVGGLGDVSCFTFFSQKSPSLGEGGMICTNDADLANHCRLAAVDPWCQVTTQNEDRENTPASERDRTPLALSELSEFPRNTARGHANELQSLTQGADGYHATMNELTASLGLAQLRRTKGLWQRRREIAVTYNACFSRFVELQCPADRDDSQHAWHHYLLRLNLQRLRIGRNEFLAELRARNIGATVMPPPLHLQPIYAALFGYQPESCPVATQEYAREISLPIYSRLADADVQRVIDAVEGVVQRFRLGTANSRW